MNQIFDWFFRGGSSEEASWGVQWIPPVDLYVRLPTRSSLAADLPGLTADEIHIEVHDHTLTLRGERKPEAGTQEERPAAGAGLRRLPARLPTLPTTVEAEKVPRALRTASSRCSFRRSEAAKPKRIAVQS